MQPNEILRGFREDKDLNQTQLGKLLNMSQRRISRIETGEIALTAEDIKSFCKFFNISADYLLGLPENLPYPKR